MEFVEQEIEELIKEMDALKAKEMEINNRLKLLYSKKISEYYISKGGKELVKVISKYDESHVVVTSFQYSKNTSEIADELFVDNYIKSIESLTKHYEPITYDEYVKELKEALKVLENYLM